MEKEAYMPDFPDLYRNFYEEITAHPGKPYHMGNEPLARAYYEKLKETRPGAFLLVTETSGQFITITDRARKKVAESMAEDAAKYDRWAANARSYAEMAGSHPAAERRGDPFRAYLAAVGAALKAAEEKAGGDAKERYAVSEQQRLLDAIRGAYDEINEIRS